MKLFLLFSLLNLPFASADKGDTLLRFQRIQKIDIIQSPGRPAWGEVTLRGYATTLLVDQLQGAMEVLVAAKLHDLPVDLQIKDIPGTDAPKLVSKVTLRDSIETKKRRTRSPQ